MEFQFEMDPDDLADALDSLVKQYGHEDRMPVVVRALYDRLRDDSHEAMEVE